MPEGEESIGVFNGAGRGYGEEDLKGHLLKRGKNN
jgi:hypothetical protein